MFSIYPAIGNEERMGPIEYGDDLVLTPNKDTHYSPNFPYLVISTEEDIIKDHNAIYGENFTDFLRRFYVSHINARINFPRKCFPEDRQNSKVKWVPGCTFSDITKCVQSCEKEDGSSCSSRTGNNG